MKPPSEIFFCDKRSKSFCLDSKLSFKKHFAQNLGIYNQHNICVFPVKETKLIHKLLKSRANYDDLRCRVISESLISLNDRGKMKCKKNLQPIEAQRVKAIIQLITAVDKGADLGTDNTRRSRCSSVKSKFRIFSRSQDKLTQCCVCPEDQRQDSSVDVHAEKPRRKTNIFLKRVVKKSNNRTTCVQVQAIESIDDDSSSPTTKEPCDSKELLKSFKNSLPKECRKAVQGYPKVDSPNVDHKKQVKIKTCMPCIAECCFKKKSKGYVNPIASNKSSRSVACQGKTVGLRKKAAQVKVSIVKKGTSTDPPRAVVCSAKIKDKKKSEPKKPEKSRDNSRSSSVYKKNVKEKKSPKQKVPQVTPDTCTCNKNTQTKSKKKSKSKNEDESFIKLEKKKKESVTSSKKEKKKQRNKKTMKKPSKVSCSKNETQNKKTKCLPCNKCSHSVNCCEIVNRSNRKVNTRRFKLRSKSCGTLVKNLNQPKQTTSDGKIKSKLPDKEKPVKKPKAEKKTKSGKKSNEEPPKKCQLIRLGSNFSFQIEFYKDRSKVNPEKSEKQEKQKYENEKVDKREKKKRLKNKYSTTKVAKPAKTVTKSTKTKRTCCSMCYFAKVYRRKSNFKLERVISSSRSAVKFPARHEDNRHDVELDDFKKSLTTFESYSSSLKTFSIENIVSDYHIENRCLSKYIYTRHGINDRLAKDFFINSNNMRFHPVCLTKKILMDCITPFDLQRKRSLLLILRLPIFQTIFCFSANIINVSMLALYRVFFLVNLSILFHNFKTVILFMKQFYLCFICILVDTLL